MQTGQVAVLGAGLLGSGFVQSLRKQGLAVKVYNRTAEKARALEALGAVVASDPVSAVEGADRVHVVLSDDAAVDAVLNVVLESLPKLTGPVIDHTTVSPAGARARTERFAALGRRYVHAPVFMGPVNARDATGLMLLSGPEEAHADLLPALQAMTGRVLNVSARPGDAAAFKLFGNAALITLCAASSDILAMARAQGIDGEVAMSLFSQFDVAPALRGRGLKMAKGQYEPPSFELSMARKDVRLMLEAAGPEGLIALPAIASRMDELLQQGFGSDDLASLGRPFRRS